MDFFEAQARAQRRTKRLVFLFALAVLGTVAAGYATAMAALHQIGPEAMQSGYDASPNWWDLRIFLWVAGGTCAVVGFASLFKWSQLRSGGSAVAEMAGGRRIDPGHATPDERRLLNVVEEMAIASGTPMPAVYVLDNEPAINAFAAGLHTSDAVVAVTRGTLEKLSRDELQGVVGHEFSHILNGDMRLNVKLTAIVFGILVIGLIGRGILQSLGRGRIRTGGNGKNKGGGILVIVAAGLALMIIGYVGYFFGRLIQAAVSRQREFLADASAVQFTRNPAGITGALRKIGGYALGSKILDRHSAELGHFFFAQGFRSMFGGVWATHPPLDERIRAIDPQWDGRLFEPKEVVDVAKESFADAGLAGGSARLAPAEPPPLRAAPARIPFSPPAVLTDVGALADTHFRSAQALLQNIPDALRHATGLPVRAQAVVCGLLPSPGTPTELVARHAGAAVAEALADLRPALDRLDPAARLPLLLLCMPALRTLNGEALDRFVTTLDELVHADGQVGTFEFVLQKMLTHHLQLARAATPPSTKFYELSAVTGDISTVLTVLARADHGDETAVAAAFLAGAGQLPSVAANLRLLPAAEAGFEAVDTALGHLALASLPVKKRLLAAAAHTIARDGTVTVAEGELFRAIAVAIDCPVPLLNAVTDPA